MSQVELAGQLLSLERYPPSTDSNLQAWEAADEYLLQEQEDALEVIDWLCSQPWCDGNVGMMGISWGGFNGLQVAARQPKAKRLFALFYGISLHLNRCQPSYFFPLPLNAYGCRIDSGFFAALT